VSRGRRSARAVRSPIAARAARASLNKRLAKSIPVTADIHHSRLCPIPSTRLPAVLQQRCRRHGCTSYRSGASSARNDRVSDGRGWLGGFGLGAGNKLAGLPQRDVHGPVVAAQFGELPANNRLSQESGPILGSGHHPGLSSECDAAARTPCNRIAGMSRWCVRLRDRGKPDDRRAPHRAELVTVGHRVGGLVIHFPAVICTSSPNTVKMLTLRRRDSGASGNATGPTYR